MKTLWPSTAPHSTRDFIKTDHTYWKAVPRQGSQVGDAFVYDSGGSGHIVVVSKVDSSNWGQPTVIEARGCAYGIVENVKKLGPEYQNRRKK